ncbi:MAG: AI-2E family transporter [Firmicutes bacterium]|nr:AI-2E family transporter [Bacillota bacterium]
MKRFEKYYGWIAAFVFCIAVIAVYKTFDNLSNITQYIGTVIGALKPFIIAFIIAYVLNMPAKHLQSWLNKSKRGFIKKHSLGISIFAIYIAALVVVVLILRMLIPALYKNVIDLYNNLPEYVASLRDYLYSFEIIKNLNFTESGFDLYSAVNKLFTSVDMTQFAKYAQGVFSVTTGLFEIFVAVIASIYMLIDKERLQRGIVRVMGIFFKKERAEGITAHAKRINDIFTNYIYSRLTCSIIMAVVCSVVLMIFNVKYALILGIFIGAMDMIPYFGSIISCVIAIIVTCITGGMWKGVWVGIALIVLQQIDGNLLGPKIMGNSLEIRPLWIIFAVSVGGTLFGFLGMLFSVPVVAIIRAIASDFIDAREAKNRMPEDSESNGE